MQRSVSTRRWEWLPIPVGMLSACIAVVPDTRLKLAMTLPAVVVAILWWSVLSTQRWLFVFFLVALLTPPLPSALGSAGVHLAPLLVIPGLFAAAMYIRAWRRPPASITAAFLTFLAALVLSAALGSVYSGVDAGLSSLVRVGLFAIGVFVFLYACAGPAEIGYDPISLARFLFFAAVAAAFFGCADFFLHFPVPGGFAEQFVWLDEGVFRRAQGLFYEASTFGNFCCFFLVMIVVAASGHRRSRPASLPAMAAAAVVLGAALILSYSRASLLNFLIACSTLLFLRRSPVWRILLPAATAAAVSIAAIRMLWPSFSASYWSRISASLQFFRSSPDGVLSGRIGNWKLLAEFLVGQPWHAVFGIGYKTLAVTGVSGTPVIADNTYLSLLVETGVVGLCSFLALNYFVLREGLRAARHSDPRAAFFGEWIFCFWVGEMAQMLSGDLITYWRVLPVYFWVLGTAIRRTSAEA